MINNVPKGSKAISLTQQNYIESIAYLLKRNGQARTTDLASLLSVSMPSVSEGVRRLVERGFAARKSWHEIVLTREGESVAHQLDRRQKVLVKFMVKVLAMEPNKADKLACRIEHCIDREFVDRLIKLAEFLDSQCADHQKPMRRYVRTE